LQPNDLHDARQRFGSLMMRHGELRTDFRPLRLTVTHHAPCQQQGHGIATRLIATQADGGLAGPIDDLATRPR
jgi:hypothetical protein